MSPDDFLSCLDSLGNGLPWTIPQEQAHSDDSEPPHSTSSETPAQSDFGNLTDPQPTDLAFTLPDATTSTDPLERWSIDAFLDGIGGETDTTNTDYNTQDTCLLDNHETGTDASQQFWDNGVDLGLLSGKYNGAAVSTTIDTIPPSALPTQVSTFDTEQLTRVFPVSFTRGDDLGYHPVANKVYGKSPFSSAPADEDLQELVAPDWWKTCDERLNSSMMELLPTDRFYLLNQGDEHTGASCSNYPTGANHPSFEHAVLAATPNIIPFDRSGSNQMNVDSFVPVQSSSYARHVVPRIPYYMPPNDRYPEASSSSQTIPNETFGRKQVSNQPLVSHNANFNSIGRIGAPPTKNCKGRSGALKKARNSPYKPKAPGPQNSRRDICPPPSVEKFFADGRNKYVRLTDFQINELLKVYNVASHKIPELFFGLQRIHSPEVLYTCPMEACKAEYTLDQLETHYLAHHSTISCDSSCPSRGDKASTNHTSLCRWFISCEDHEYTATFSATEARAHFEDVHLYPHGVQCPHCGSLHPRLRLLYMHMSGKGCSGLRKWRRSE